MNPQELELASKIMGELRNTTGYGYETLVKGTVLSNGLDIIGVVLWCVSMAVIIGWTRRRWKLGEASGDELFGYLIFLAAVGTTIAIVYSVLFGAMLGMVAPEYTVINKIIEKAARQ